MLYPEGDQKVALRPTVLGLGGRKTWPTSAMTDVVPIHTFTAHGLVVDCVTARYVLLHLSSNVDKHVQLHADLQFRVLSPGTLPRCLLALGVISVFPSYSIVKNSSIGAITLSHRALISVYSSTRFRPRMPTSPGSDLLSPSKTPGI